ncbi:MULTISPECIES: RNA polymerase-binding protein RbpA [Micrococcaceae]|uniref:RNA polymerase-binding protein RbpA n=1 Tax=Micrococcaceae TaxID=1268 RepID=UPI0012FAFB6E|nr:MULTISPECIES: RNA polymerase-binding protein RbpA [Pseudarthrobacter]MEA3550863.1 RNA polymerase-binding protein RbpA [Pseudarthrobacter sp. C1]MUU73708.1 RNA polymerase-binding protein RbpA [Pseudarthrobacter sp. GA104]WPU11251.1 RNA polymerase-binding protein RbpA [Pseudarthrobacter oxydans]HET7783918.1 RNA polymerase-binding protein RbpA [Arthrobacter sp.]
MIHPSSGFRGTRAGVTEGTGFSFESEDHGKPLPRIRVSYWCAKGHETTPVFLKLPEDQIPLVWDCRKCGGPASRDGEAAAADALDDGYKSHLEYVKERRSDQDAEDVLAGALEKLRARGVLPDELLGDT